MENSGQLRRALSRLDGRGYKSYKDIRGSYGFDRFTLHIDHVQGDPYAKPSRVRLRVPLSAAGIPDVMLRTAVQRLAVRDFLARRMRSAIERGCRGRPGSGGGGRLSVDAGGQEILDRTAVSMGESWVEARIRVGLPASGRRILGREAATLLCDELPAVALAALVWGKTPPDDAGPFVESVENYTAIRDQLAAAGLVAFVADGAILPRESGASDRPLAGHAAVAFRSCESLRVSMELPNPARPGGVSSAGRATGPSGGATPSLITGMGIPRGVTLIVGGGYHGKSTLLRALERGVYPHVPGDGREYVVTDPTAVKIRAEDGRCVQSVDIAAFIEDLPFGRDTSAFTTTDASGSTSQAANIVEALETGAGVLLLDEDTSATNFMVRDARMQALIADKDEPITPFIDRVRHFYDAFGVSTILVMGGCGDYFDVADRVIAMRGYRPRDDTARAREISRHFPAGRAVAPAFDGGAPRGRVVHLSSIDPSRGRHDVKIDAPATGEIRFGRTTIELRAVEQLVDASQTRAVGQALRLAAESLAGNGGPGHVPVSDFVDSVESLLDEKGLDVLDPHHRPGEHPGEYARPRPLEIAAALNRLRAARFERA